MNENIVPIRAGIVTPQPSRDAKAFADLTVTVALARLRDGTLEPGFVEALLAYAGVVRQ